MKLILSKIAHKIIVYAYFFPIYMVIKYIGISKCESLLKCIKSKQSLYRNLIIKKICFGMGYYIELYKLNILETIKEIPFSLRDIPMSFKRFNIGNLKFTKPLLRPSTQDVFKILQLDEALTQQVITIEESSFCNLYTYAPTTDESLHSIKDLRTFTIQDATIRSGFHVFAGDKFIRINQSYTPTIEFPWGDINYTNKDLGIFSLSRTTKAFNINLKAFLLASWADRNYFHFFIEGLARIKEIHKLIAKIPDLHLIVSDSMPYQHYQALFYLFPHKNIILAGPRTHLLCKELYVSEFPVYLKEEDEKGAERALYNVWYAKENILYLRKCLTAALRKSNQLFDNKKSPKRIFLHRKEYRTIINFPKIKKVLKKYGFTIIDTKEYEFAQQANIFYNAQVILGVSGAAMTNMIFCKNKAKILLVTADITSHSCVYSSLARILELDFKLFVGEAYIEWFKVFRYGKAVKPNSNLTLNCKKLDDFLQSVL